MITVSSVGECNEASAVEIHAIVMDEIRILIRVLAARRKPDLSVLFVNAVNAAITAIVLERLADLPWPAVWFCAVLLVSAARTVLWLRHRRADGPAKADGSWAVLAAGGALAAGLCWGVGGALLFTVLPVQGQMFLPS